jgi:thiamine pyrophosphokinase
MVIVGGGTVEPALLQRFAMAGYAVVAADGGADICKDAGVMPEAIIGDIDSLDGVEQWRKATQIIEIAEQETTDFEKCLYSTDAPVTIALGMTGGRFDHTLAALDAVARYADKRRIVLVDEEDVALGVSGSFAGEVGAGERVSVHPLGSVKFAHSEGLKYPLDGLELAPGIRTGTSNQAVSDIISIEAAPGGAPWLLILSRDHLPMLIGAAG